MVDTATRSAEGIPAEAIIANVSVCCHHNRPVNFTADSVHKRIDDIKPHLDPLHIAAQPIHTAGQRGVGTFQKTKAFLDRDDVTFDVTDIAADGAQQRQDLTVGVVRHLRSAFVENPPSNRSLPRDFTRKLAANRPFTIYQKSKPPPKHDKRPDPAYPPRTTRREPTMKIAKIEDLHADAGWRTFSFLKITTDDGLVGWSEYTEADGSRGLTSVIHRSEEHTSELQSPA